MSHEEVSRLVLPRCAPLHYRFMTDAAAREAGSEVAAERAGGLAVAPFPPGGAASSLSGRFLAMPDVIDAALEAERRSLQEVLISGAAL
jgi:hypothetical protein